MNKALKLLASAKRPLIILGKGAAYAQADDNIRQFIETTGIPYLPMSMAKGLLPDTHPLSAASARSFALSSADVVVLMGARLNWLLDHGKGKHWSPETQFIQLDIEPSEIDSNRPIAAPVVGDIYPVLSHYWQDLNQPLLNLQQNGLSVLMSTRKSMSRKWQLS